MKSYLFVETQYDNLGDALINRELMLLAAQHSKVVGGTKNVPQHFREMLGQDFWTKIEEDTTSGRGMFLLKILLRALKGEKSILFLSPGGWIGEIDGNLNLRTWAHTALYHMLALAGVRLCQIGVSYEDIGPKLMRFLKARSSAMFMHVVRDQESRELMERNGVKIHGVCPDLAFNKFSVSLPAVKAKQPKGISFSFRTAQYEGQIEDDKAVIEAVVKAYGDETPVYFVSQVHKDDKGMAKLSEWFNKAYNAKTVVDYASTSVDETQAAYKRSSVVVSNRLHSLLLAGSVQNTMIAAPINNTNKKIISLFNDVGLNQHVVTPGTDVETVVKDIPLVPFDAKAQKAELEGYFSRLFKA